MTVRDTGRSKVYAAETMWHRLMERPGIPTEVGGVPLCLEPEQWFAGIEGIRAYTVRVLAHPEVIRLAGPVPPVAVRERKGDRSAHYETATKTIAIHVFGAGWQLREAVVLHEIAHHLSASYGDTGHGPGFRKMLAGLAEEIIGPQAGLALRLCYVDAGFEKG